ncbi:MAG: YggS family pyridoxal phosphate-dependent enzyme [Silvanigrellaceae bacterium]|nr:YggS family pyridoxal phosphate-dependent enzyme [Silvanigrellaceae bacterium]
MILKENLFYLQERINKCCAAFHLNPSNITLVAVSKKQSIDSILTLYHLGIRDFAENYVQEWLEKAKALSHLPDLRWHFIGHLQSNKVKFLHPQTSLLQSLDSLALAEKISLWTKKNHSTLECLVQLRIDKTQTSKTGIEASNAKALCSYLQSNPNIRWRGFMGIGSQNSSNAETAKDFKEFYEQAMTLWKEFHPQNLISNEEKPIISLGMSEDLELALQAGSTLLRIGTALFGQR